MFTGIIQEVGKISRITRRASHWQIGISSKIVYPKVDISGSVSVNGTCLTLVKKEASILYFDVISATLKISNLKRLRVSDFVNLESSLALGDKLEGHFVLGHIDCEAKLRKTSRIKGNLSLEVNLPPQYKKFVIPRGSIALDGISLTVGEVKSNSFLVNIIPYTWQETNLKYKKIGSYFNLEFDYLLKASLDKV